MEAEATAASEGNAHIDYTQFLDEDGLRGARIGVAEWVPIMLCAFALHFLSSDAIASGAYRRRMSAVQLRRLIFSLAGDA